MLWLHATNAAHSGALRFAGLPDLYTFECEACGETHVEEAATEQRMNLPLAKGQQQ
jgi:hypothetical protein